MRDFLKILKEYANLLLKNFEKRTLKSIILTSKASCESSLLLIMVVFASLCGCASDKKTLHVYSWACYVKPDVIEKFESLYNCKVVIDTFDANESMFAKFSAGASGYDIIVPSNYFVGLMIHGGLLQPIQQEKIPNLVYLDKEHPIFNPTFDLSYCVPYMIGYTGIGYRKDKIKEIDSSWKVFARKDLNGRMTVVNDIREAFGSALKHLGYSCNSINQEEINAAAELLIQWKRNLAKFDNEQYKNGIASGEYLVSQGYSGDIVQVVYENESVGFILPEEGTHISCDYFVIPRSAHEVELAHQFINFLLDPGIATENSLFLCYICPHTEVYKRLPEEIKNNFAYFPPKNILDKSESIHDIGEHIILYNKAWDHVKDAY